MKKISLKKKLNQALLNKKLIYNLYGVVLCMPKEIKIEGVKVIFNKTGLKNIYLSSFLKKTIVHFPLNFFFFTTYSNFLYFFKKYFNTITLIKYQNKLFKKHLINLFFFTNRFIEKGHYNFFFTSI